MQSNTVSEVDNKPEKEKEKEKPKEVVKETPVNEVKVKVKEDIIKETKCSLICGDVNYII
jgi:hypothetical protein